MGRDSYHCLKQIPDVRTGCGKNGLHLSGEQAAVSLSSVAGRLDISTSRKLSGHSVATMAPACYFCWLDVPLGE